MEGGMSPRLIDLEDELKTRLAEVTADRDSMKAWCASLFAHVCRLTGNDGSGAPQELKAIAGSHHAERAELVRKCDVLLTAVKEIASRVSPESRHQEWAAANGCDCVVCVAVAALKALDPK
jgi:hypothetical protein